MNIGKIKDILSGYGSEKGFDFVISKVRELSKNKQLKENINELIKLELSAFEKADRDGEYDFPGLIDFLKEFGSESFIESYVYAYIESDSLENKKELIRKECIRDTKANAQESEQSVRRIVDRCFSIVDEHLLSCLSKEELIQARVIIKSIEEALKQQTESIEAILQTYLNKFTTLFSLHASSTTYHACPSLITDNQAYLDAFINPLFLEDEEEDKNIISLADMYISPSIKGKDIKASECVNKWYNTRKKPCLLLYGNAGVGKSSFVSKILADVNGITEESKREFKFDSSKVIAVALRNHTDKIDNKLTPTEILTTLFSSDSVDQLQDKLIILDGLDELCVLIPGFDGQSFLSKLSSLGNGFHVLVTSREAKSYFSPPNDVAGLKTERLVWKKEQIDDWLEHYKDKKSNKEKWCKTFKGQLKPNDPRCAIFCVPIILYICGTSETDLKNHSSIGSIYRDAFHKILLRNYIQGQHNTYELREADKEAALIAWQYTKELAYQMFLLNTLDLVDDDELEERHAIGFRNAKKRTADILKEEYNIINPDLELKKELAICPFAKEIGTGGITFAHKTVYEYFTAVKLYEDYFARFDTAYFKTNNEATAAKEVMESFIEAFRYEAISHEIFNHICEMNEAPLLSKLGYCKSTGLNYTKYENAFTFAMQKHMYAIIGMKPAVKEYLYASFSKLERKYTNWHSKSLEIQMNTSYANFTWFLTIHGFTNEKRIQECMLIGSLLYNSLIAACLERWHFENADLQYYHLEKANLFDAHLEQTNFKGAYLQEACLQEAHLKDAIFKDANLFKANLENSDLTRANFTYANLKRVQMNMANLTNANLKEASLIFANLTRANLTSANFEGSNMKGAHLNKAKLKSANLQNANLEGAFFEYADLRKAVLKGSILIDADFIKANLSDADLSYTDLSDANMSGTDLRLTNLTGAIMKSAKYCNDPLLETIFPTDFDPEEHGMIEVDIDGNPVKDQ